ncbi:MAG TPA: outer membrane lipoprotein carrier protein LolA [Planctomycetota bacterium]|nr:outer membrane lipoprotein carrier protein LolA [Planctomycetota bacterium]
MRSLILGLFIAAVAAAEPFTLERLAAISRDIATVRIPFVQEKRLAILPDPVTAEGIIEISRPLAAVRWEFTGRSLMILADGRMRRWDDRGSEQVGDDPSLEALGAQMRALLSGDFAALGELFVVTPDPDGAPALTLTPKRAELKRYIERIALRFRADLSAPEELAIVAPGDDLTTYRFAEPQVDIELTPARFAGP